MSALAAASSVPAGFQSRSSTTSRGASSTVISCGSPPVTSQTRIDESRPAAASLDLSGLNATAMTSSCEPPSRARSRGRPRSETSSRWTSPPIVPAASRLPSPDRSPAPLNTAPAPVSVPPSGAGLEGAEVSHSVTPPSAKTASSRPLPSNFVSKIGAAARLGSAVASFHTRAVPSVAADTIDLPLSLNTAHVTTSGWSRTSTVVQEAASSTRSVESALPTTRWAPSGLNAVAVIFRSNAPVSSLAGLGARGAEMSHDRRARSSEPATSTFPSGENDTAGTPRSPAASTASSVAFSPACHRCTPPVWVPNASRPAGP
nr:hypothetical protein [Lentzea flava]